MSFPVNKLAQEIKIRERMPRYKGYIVAPQFVVQSDRAELFARWERYIAWATSQNIRHNLIPDKERLAVYYKELPYSKSR